MTPNQFYSDTSGAVTVDWVVLTAALVGMGLAVMSVVSPGVQDVSTDVDDTLTGIDPSALYADWGPFQFAPLAISQSSIDYFIEFYSVNNSDAQVENWYTQRYNEARTALDSGDAITAAGAIDYAYVFEQSLINRNAAVPDLGNSVEELYKEHQAL